MLAHTPIAHRNFCRGLGVGEIAALVFSAQRWYRRATIDSVATQPEQLAYYRTVANEYETHHINAKGETELLSAKFRKRLLAHSPLASRNVS
jgi:hypothetical protein